MRDTIEKIKSNKGITLITLVITIIIALILTTVTITSTYTGVDYRDYKSMCSDIELLENKILLFYREYGELPTSSKVTSLPTEIDNGHTFYKINLKKLGGMTLNNGNSSDIYIVDSETFEVYYLNGVEYQGEIYYTD